MPRTLLLILIVVGGLLMFNTCGKSKELLPPAVDRVAAGLTSEEDLVSMAEGKRNRRVLLTGDGGVVLAKEGDAALVRADVPLRRPLQLLLGKKGGARRALSAGKWSSREIAGGQEFTWKDGETQITKTVVFTEDGSGLKVTLTATGLGEEVNALIVTGPTGVPLPGGESTLPGGIFLAHGERTDFRSWDRLAQKQEVVRADLQRLKDAKELPSGAAVAYEDATPLAEGGTTHRFGVLGERGFVSLEGIPGGATAFTEAYLLSVGGSPARREVEGWVALPATGGAYRGELLLRFGTIDELKASEAALFQRPEMQVRTASEHRLENGTLRVDFSDRGAAIVEASLKRIARAVRVPPGEGQWVDVLHRGVPPGFRPLTLSVQDIERFGADPAHEVWSVERADRSLHFTLRTPRGWLFTKRVTLPEEGRYDLRVEIGVEPPPGSKEGVMNFTLVGPAGAYVEDVYRGISAGDPVMGLRLERRGGDGDSRDIDSFASDPMNRDYPSQADRGLMKAIAVRGAYFVVALATPDRVDAAGAPLGSVAQATLRSLEMERDIPRPDGTTSRANLLGQVTCSVDLARGPAAESFLLYAGPNDLRDLRPLGLEDMVNFGVFGFIGRALMWLMKLYQSLVGSFGIAIVLMTITVRAILAPVSYRTQLGMQRYSQRIQKIKPLLEEVEKKYRGNPQRLSQERLLVMREHKVGFPLGCLTIFLQIPIWYGLFQALRVEYSLRHQPFLWAADLAMPDRVLHLPFWPHWFNLFPILMLALWIWQQQLTPTAQSDDPNIRAQMKMMKFFPYLFFVFLYNYAAALSVYMCISSLWSILESRLVRKAIARLS